MFRDDDTYIGKLIGNTGQPDKLTVALRTSFSAPRGEFVRVAHQGSGRRGGLLVPAEVERDEVLAAPEGEHVWGALRRVEQLHLVTRRGPVRTAVED